MEEFFANQFSPTNILGNLMWMVIGTALARAWIVFKGFSLDRKRELFFWFLCPLTIFFVVSAITYATQTGNNSTIDLKATIDGVTVHTKNETSEDILLIVSVRNRGMDSIVEWGDLTIQIGQDKPLTAERQTMPHKLILPRSPSSSETITYFGKDALYNKTLVRPVTKGSLVRGLLMFETKNVKHQSLIQPGNKFRLSFFDVFGIEHSVDYSWPSQTNLPRGYIPGMDTDFGQISNAPETPQDATKH